MSVRLKRDLVQTADVSQGSNDLRRIRDRSGSTLVAFATEGRVLLSIPTKAPSSDTASSRFAFLDALRGLAALCVASFHIYQYEPAPENAQQFLPRFIDHLLVRGWIGVQILLVISGFVIAHSFRDGRVSWSGVTNFWVRRVVRLSPPYLVTLAIVLLVHFGAIWSGWFPSLLDEPPSWPRVASHVIYVQDLVGYSNLSAGLWTVCIEMQFYLLFGIVILVARGTWPRERSGQLEVRPGFVAALFSPLAAMSLFAWCNEPTMDRYVPYFFCLFYLGMMTWWSVDQRISQLWYWVTIAAFVVRLSVQWKSEILVGLITSLMSYVAGRSGHLHDWLNFRWLQYLGRVSYSLYLVHYAVVHVVTHVIWRIQLGTPTPMLSAVGLLVALAASIGAAQLMYVGVEAPSSRLSAQLKRNESS